MADEKAARKVKVRFTKDFQLHVSHGAQAFRAGDVAELDAETYEQNPGFPMELYVEKGSVEEAVDKLKQVQTILDSVPMEIRAKADAAMTKAEAPHQDEPKHEELSEAE